MNTMGLHVAVVGATGAVGQQMLETLEKRDFPIKQLTLLSSARSAGSRWPRRRRRGAARCVGLREGRGGGEQEAGGEGGKARRHDRLREAAAMSRSGGACAVPGPA